MGEYFLATTTRRISKAKAKQLQAELRQLDPSMELVAPVDIPGNQTHGWICRPNDGTNNQRDQSALNQQAARMLADVAA